MRWLVSGVFFLVSCGESEEEAKARMRREIIEELQGRKPESPRELPAQFRSLKPPSGSGEVLVSDNNRGGAREILNASLDALASYFDRRPIVVSACAEKNDSALQAVLACATDGSSKRAIARVQAGTIAVLVDKKETFEQSFPVLAQLMAPPKKNIEWNMTQIPDGSGTLRLPTGWKITGAVKSMVSIAGPAGQLVDLGIWYQVYTPQAASQMFARPPLVAGFSDPAAATRELFPQLAATFNVRAALDRIVEQAPVEYPNGTAAFLHCEFTINQEKRKGLSLVIMSPVGDGTWIYYTSGCSSSAGTFAENFPVMWEIWSSWKVSDHVYRRRMSEALQSMREAHQIYQQANANTQQVFSDANAKWSEAIRGTQHVRDDRYDKIQEVPTYGLDKVVETLNREEGYDRWTIIPVEQLNK